jgi:hypothetical protein
VNCLLQLQAKRVLVDCRGLESALEAVRVSVEVLRVLIEALRCFRGRESVAEAKKLPVEVVREPARKILEQIKTFCFRSKVYRLYGKVPLLF